MFWQVFFVLLVKCSVSFGIFLCKDFMTFCHLVFMIIYDHVFLSVVFSPPSLAKGVGGLSGRPLAGACILFSIVRLFLALWLVDLFCLRISLIGLDRRTLGFCNVVAFVPFCSLLFRLLPLLYCLHQYPLVLLVLIDTVNF